MTAPSIVSVSGTLQARVAESNGGGGSATTCTNSGNTWPNSGTLGNRELVITVWDDVTNTMASCADANGGLDTFAPVAFTTGSGAGNGQSGAAFICNPFTNNPTGPQAAYTVTAAASGHPLNWEAFGFEITGAQAVHKMTWTDGASGQPSASITTTVGNCLLIAYVVLTGAATNGGGGAWTDIPGTPTSFGYVVSQQTATAAGTYTYTPTTDGSAWGVVIVAIQPPVTGPQFVQGGTPSYGAASAFHPTIAGQTSGNDNLVCINANWDGADPTVTGTNAYTLVGSKIQGSGASAVYSAIFKSIRIASGSETVTVTFSSSTTADCQILEYSGADTAELLGTSSGASGNPSYSVTARASEMVVAAACQLQTNGFTAGSGFTDRWDNSFGPSPNLSTIDEDHSVSVAGSVTVGATGTSAAWSSVAVGLFMSASSPPTWTLSDSPPVTRLPRRQRPWESDAWVPSPPQRTKFQAWTVEPARGKSPRLPHQHFAEPATAWVPSPPQPARFQTWAPEQRPQREPPARLDGADVVGARITTATVHFVDLAPPLVMPRDRPPALDTEQLGAMPTPRRAPAWANDVAPSRRAPPLADVAFVGSSLGWAPTSWVQWTADVRPSPWKALTPETPFLSGDLSAIPATSWVPWANDARGPVPRRVPPWEPENWEPSPPQPAEFEGWSIEPAPVGRPPRKRPPWETEPALAPAPPQPTRFVPWSTDLPPRADRPPPPDGADAVGHVGVAPLVDGELPRARAPRPAPLDAPFVGSTLGWAPEPFEHWSVEPAHGRWRALPADPVAPLDATTAPPPSVYTAWTVEPVRGRWRALPAEPAWSPSPPQAARFVPWTTEPGPSRPRTAPQASADAVSRFGLPPLPPVDAPRPQATRARLAELMVTLNVAVPAPTSWVEWSSTPPRAQRGRAAPESVDVPNRRASSAFTQWTDEHRSRRAPRFVAESVLPLEVFVPIVYLPTRLVPSDAALCLLVCSDVALCLPAATDAALNALLPVDAALNVAAAADVTLCLLGASDKDPNAS